MSRVALLVAADSYDEPSYPPLTAPVVDVVRLAEQLRDPAVGAFDAVELSVNEACHDVMGAVEDLLAERQPDDLVLLYFSCHGIPDDTTGEVYFAVANTRAHRRRSSAVPARFVNAAMSECVAGSRVLLLDCCYSGAYAASLGAKSAPSQPLSELSGRGYAVLTASDAWSSAYEDAGYSHFTDAVVEGLRTGRADRDGDGLISTVDLFDHVSETLRDTGRQRPQYISPGADGKIVLAYAPGPGARDQQPAAGVPRAADPAPQVPPARGGPFPPPVMRRTWADWSALVTEGLARLDVEPDLPAENWATALFDGERPAAAALLAWAPEALPAVIDHVREDLMPDTRPPGAPGNSPAWNCVVHGWWAEGQAQFAALTGGTSTEFHHWWGLGLCQAQAGALGRAAESFAKAARYASVQPPPPAEETLHAPDPHPVTSEVTVEAGAVLLAETAARLTGADRRRPLDTTRQGVATVTDLRLARALAAEDTDALYRVLVSDPATGLLGLALAAAGSRPPLPVQAVTRAHRPLHILAGDWTRRWAELREAAGAFDVRVPEWSVQARPSPDGPEAFADTAGTLLRGRRLLLSSFTPAHDVAGSWTAPTGRRERGAAEARVVRLVDELSGHLLPRPRHATLLPPDRIADVVAFAPDPVAPASVAGSVPSGVIVPTASGGTHHPYLTARELADQRARFIWWESERKERDLLRQAVYADDAFAAWLTGASGVPSWQRPGRATGRELAAVLSAADVPQWPRLLESLFGRIKQRGKQGWLVTTSPIGLGFFWDRPDEDDRFSTVEAAGLYLLPDGSAQYVRTGRNHRNEWTDSRILFPADHLYSSDHLRSLRENIILGPARSLRASTPDRPRPDR